MTVRYALSNEIGMPIGEAHERSTALAFEDIAGPTLRWYAGRDTREGRQQFVIYESLTSAARLRARVGDLTRQLHCIALSTRDEPLMVRIEPKTSHTIRFPLGEIN
jgi:hypothetical protein